MHILTIHIDSFVCQSNQSGHFCLVLFYWTLKWSYYAKRHVIHFSIFVLDSIIGEIGELFLSKDLLDLSTSRDISVFKSVGTAIQVFNIFYARNAPFMLSLISFIAFYLKFWCSWYLTIVWYARKFYLLILQDIATAKLVYDTALVQGVGSNVEL